MNDTKVLMILGLLWAVPILKKIPKGVEGLVIKIMGVRKGLFILKK